MRKRMSRWCSLLILTQVIHHHIKKFVNFVSRNRIRPIIVHTYIDTVFFFIIPTRHRDGVFFVLESEPKHNSLRFGIYLVYGIYLVSIILQNVVMGIIIRNADNNFIRPETVQHVKYGLFAHFWLFLNLLQPTFLVQ